MIKRLILRLSFFDESFVKYISGLIMISKWVKKIFIWRHHHLADHHFFYIISILVGLLSGLGAVLLKNFTHYIALLSKKIIDELSFDFAYVFLPLLGIFIVFLIKKYIFKKEISYGIATTLKAIAKEKGLIAPSKIYTSLITAPITVGFGGSVGLEGPTVSTGAAIGANLGRFFRMREKDRMLLIGCATAAAVACMFKAPVTGVVFALEIFSLDLAFSALIPLLIAAIASVVTSHFFFGSELLFTFKIKDVFQITDLGHFMLFGVFTGLFSVYFSRIHFKVMDFFKGLNDWTKFLLGGCLLALLLYTMPALFGEGYALINALLHGEEVAFFSNEFLYQYLEGHFSSLIILLSGVVLLKVFAMSITLGAGGVGGLFIPTLFMGSVLGNLFAKILNYLNFGSGISESNFTLVGMTGLMAGVLHAPLTAIFLIAEITGGYELFIPLILVATVSFIVSRYFLAYPIHAAGLAKTGSLLTHNKDQNILTMLNIDAVVERNFVLLAPRMTLRQMLEEAVAKSSRNHFPVVDEHQVLVGILHLDDIRGIMFESQFYDNTFVTDLMQAPSALIFYKKDSTQQIMNKFQQTEAWTLPVVLEDGTYRGFISKSRLMTAYRNKLIRVSHV